MHIGYVVITKKSDAINCEFCCISNLHVRCQQISRNLGIMVCKICKFLSRLLVLYLAYASNKNDLLCLSLLCFR